MGENGGDSTEGEGETWKGWTLRIFWDRLTPVVTCIFLSVVTHLQPIGCYIWNHVFHGDTYGRHLATTIERSVYGLSVFV